MALICSALKPFSPFVQAVALLTVFVPAARANPNDCHGDRGKYEACIKIPERRQGTNCSDLKKVLNVCLAKVDKEHHKNAAKVTLPPGTKLERNLTGNAQQRYREEISKGGNTVRHFTGQSHRNAETARQTTGQVDKPNCRYSITAGADGLDAKVGNTAGGLARSQEYLIRQADIKRSSPSGCVPYRK